MLDYSKNKGLTLIEMMIALFIIVFGVIGTFSVIQKIVSFTSASSNKLIAAYLAQEGLEVVRNIRDTNWLQDYEYNHEGTGGPQEWDAGLSDEFPWELDYRTTCLDDTGGECLDYENCNYDPEHNCLEYNGGTFLKFDGNYYSYGLGVETIFKRKVTISKENINGGPDYYKKITVSVEWEEKGKTNRIEVQEHLYDWSF